MSHLPFVFKYITRKIFLVNSRLPICGKAKLEVVNQARNSNDIEGSQSAADPLITISLYFFFLLCACLSPLHLPGLHYCSSVTSHAMLIGSRGIMFQF